MPSSTNKTLTIITDYIKRINPNSVLDCGIGFGKWGFLCREYLDVYKGRIFPEEWRTTIIGIEGFEEYIDKFPWITKIYNKVFKKKLEDIFLNEQIYNYMQKFDLIIACDIIEHIKKEVAIKIIDKMKNKCYNLILNIPFGKEWLNNKVVSNNQLEKHQSVWNTNDFIKIFKDECKIIKWNENKKEGGIIIWPRG